MLNQAEDDYFKFSRATRQNLSTAHGIFLSLCDDGLKNRLGGEVELQGMTKRKRHYIMKSHHIMKNLCNGSTGVSVEDVMGNLLEALYSMIFIRGDECPEIPNCLEASNHRHVVLVETWLDVANKKLRDACIDELSNCM